MKCDPSARPDASSGVRVVKQYWRRGEASSYDEGDIRGSRGRPNPLADALRAFDESNAARAALDLDVGDVDPDVHPVLRALLERKRSGSNARDGVLPRVAPRTTSSWCARRSRT